MTMAAAMIRRLVLAAATERVSRCVSGMNSSAFDSRLLCGEIPALAVRWYASIRSRVEICISLGRDGGKAYHFVFEWNLLVFHSCRARFGRLPVEALALDLIRSDSIGKARAAEL